MNDKEELARDLFFAYEHAQMWQAQEKADALWAAGWRKMPSREELARVFYKSYAMAPRETVTLPKQMCADEYDGQTVEATQITVDPIIDAILALMGGEVSE